MRSFLRRNGRNGRGRTPNSKRHVRSPRLDDTPQYWHLAATGAADGVFWSAWNNGGDGPASTCGNTTYTTATKLFWYPALKRVTVQAIEYRKCGLREKTIFVVYWQDSRYVGKKQKKVVCEHLSPSFQQFNHCTGMSLLNFTTYSKPD